VTVVPSAALGVRQRVDAKRASSHHVAELQAAVGFILKGRMAVTPRAALPARFTVELRFDAR
jgi:hypothetical protein